MADELESARTLIEARFLDAGEVLSDTVDGIAALVTALDALTNALSPDTIAATTQQLAAAAATLTAMPGAQLARRATIGKLEGGREVLSSGVADMRRSLAYMRAFTVNIKITAGGIASVDPEFHLFAQETCLRVESGRSEVDGLEENLQKLQGELKAAAPRAELLARGCAAMIPAVPDQLLASAAIMAEHRRQIAAATAAAGTLARDVRKKVTRILGALQIGDSTRQRVEHVQAGIKLLDAHDPATPPDATARIRALLCALLAAQLDSTLADFSNDVAEISTGLAGLAQDAASLLRLRDVAYGKAEGGADGFMQALEQRVGAAIGLVTEIEQADALARDTGREAAAAAQSLSDRLGAVQMMKTDVLYMALNTTLKSARLGEDGRPLSIIASELRVHAGYLDTTAAACVEALKTLIDTASELSRDNGGTEGAGAGAALEAAIACIKQAGETTARDVATLASQGEAVLSLLTRSTQRLDFQKEIGGTLGQVAQNLTGRAAEAAQCGADIQAPLAAHFAKLLAIYTMVKEREIQAGIAAQWGIALPPVPAPAQAPAPAAAAVEADVFEDELF
jgi:hypothetical protein